MQGVYKVLPWGLILILILGSCAPDPRNDAEAYQIRLEAESEAAAAEQTRQIESQAAALAQAEAEAISARRVEAGRVFWSVFGIVGTIAVCAAVLGLGAGFAWASVGTGRAVVRYAEVRAGLIALPESTRQFPLLATYQGKGIISLANPNTGAVYQLDTRRAECREALAASGAVMLAGIVAREARLSTDAAGVALIPGGAVGLAEVIQIGKGMIHE